MDNDVLVSWYEDLSKRVSELEEVNRRLVELVQQMAEELSVYVDGKK